MLKFVAFVAGEVLVCAYAYGEFARKLNRVDSSKTPLDHMLEFETP